MNSKCKSPDNPQDFDVVPVAKSAGDEINIRPDDELSTDDERRYEDRAHGKNRTLTPGAPENPARRSTTSPKRSMTTAKSIKASGEVSHRQPKIVDSKSQAVTEPDKKNMNTIDQNDSATNSRDPLLQRWQMTRTIVAACAPAAKIPSPEDKRPEHAKPLTPAEPSQSAKADITRSFTESGTTPSPTSFDLTLLNVEKGIQGRAAVNEETVAAYAERMEAGDKFPMKHRINRRRLANQCPVNRRAPINSISTPYGPGSRIS